MKKDRTTDKAPGGSAQSNMKDSVILKIASLPCWVGFDVGLCIAKGVSTLNC